MAAKFERQDGRALSSGRAREIDYKIGGTGIAWRQRLGAARQ
ncbi:hypothetical protein [Mesorhizobium sp. M9A.F.Ca.ET.002.03.1.2]|nr:hypothetical protein [Mesorhizobium sp. M9A.F.Ca.ET.002.03.1.2]